MLLFAYRIQTKNLIYNSFVFLNVETTQTSTRVATTTTLATVTDSSKLNRPLVNISA